MRSSTKNGGLGDGVVVALDKGNNFIITGVLSLANNQGCSHGGLLTSHTVCPLPLF